MALETMTVPESKNRPLTSVSIVNTTTQTKVHSFVRQNPVSLASFQASQEDAGRGDHNGRVSVQPTSFEGGLLVGLYDPHHGPQCAEYLQQHLVPILDESLSTQLDHQDDSHISNSIQNLNDIDSTSGTSPCKIDPNQVIDTLKSTFLELDELLLATAITVALTQPEEVGMASADEVKKAQEVLAQVVTGSTALVGFLAPHQSFSETSLSVALAEVAAEAAAAAQGAGHLDTVQKLDLYLAQLGDSVAILAGLDEQGQWTARRLNPPETHEHSVRYPHSDEFRKVVSEAKDRALTAEQFFRQSNNTIISKDTEQEVANPESSFLTRGGKFLGLPTTRAFGDLDWKIEEEPRFSVSTWVEASLKAKIDRTLQQQQGQGETLAQEQVGINNLHDPPYVAADPRITRFILETRKPAASITSASRASDQLLILLNRGFLYSTHISPSIASSSSASSTQDKTNNSNNPYDQQLISDIQLSRVVADTLEKGEENAALAVAKALDQARKELGVVDCEGEEGHEGSVLVVVL